MNSEEMKKQAEMLTEVLAVLYKNSVNGAFLNEILFNVDEETPVPVRNLEVNKTVTKGARMEVQLTEKYVYMNLEFNYDNDMDLLSIKNIYKQFLDRYTAGIKENKPVAYQLSIQSFCMEDGYCYTVEGYNPVFSGKDRNVLTFVFEIENFKFGKEQISMKDVDEELEYEKQEAMEEYQKYASQTE